MGFGLLALGLGSLRNRPRRGRSARLVLLELHRGIRLSSRWRRVSSVVVVWELRQKQPVIDFHVLKERNFALATASMLVLGFVLYGSTARCCRSSCKRCLGYTAMLSGMVLLARGIVICIAMPVVGILLRRYQARWLVIFGVVVSAAGLIAMSHFHAASGLRTAVRRAEYVQSFGLAFLFVPISTVAFTRIPRERMNLRHGPLQSGAQHWRQFWNRRHRPRSWRAAPSITSRCWFPT